MKEYGEKERQNEKDKRKMELGTDVRKRMKFGLLSTEAGNTNADKKSPRNNNSIQKLRRKLGIWEGEGGLRKVSPNESGGLRMPGQEGG